MKIITAAIFALILAAPANASEGLVNIGVDALAGVPSSIPKIDGEAVSAFYSCLFLRECDAQIARDEVAADDSDS